MTGASIATPRNTRNAPIPIGISGFPLGTPASPRPISAAPARVSTEPIPIRIRSDRCGIATSSRIAATGGIFAARRAGKYAATTVTTTPTAYDQSTGVGVNTSPPEPSDPAQRLQRQRQTGAGRQADRRPDDADADRLADHRAGDLLARGADGAQQRQLPGALRDQHRERVEDDEAADEDRDQREDQQESTG